jgi:hypothetical protein
MGETLSDEADQKLQAVVLLVNAYADTSLSPVYLSASGSWFFNLTDAEKLVAIQAVQAFNAGDEDEALRMVAVLPVPRL